MNLSFSTRGWRYQPWDQLSKEAEELHFQGIEVYNLHAVSALIDRDGPFHRYHQQETMRQLRDHHLQIPCLDTSVDLSSPASPEDFDLLFDQRIIAMQLRDIETDQFLIEFA